MQSRFIENWEFLLKKKRIKNNYGKEIRHRTVTKETEIFNPIRTAMFSMREKTWIYERF